MPIRCPNSQPSMVKNWNQLPNFLRHLKYIHTSISIVGHSTSSLLYGQKNYGKTLHALARPLVVPLINCTKLTALCSDCLKWMHFALHSHLFFWESERERSSEQARLACQPGSLQLHTVFFCKDLLITWMDLMIKPVRSSLP